VAELRQPGQLARLHRPRVRLADPLAVGGGVVDELVGRLQRAGQGRDRGLARACQVQVARDRGPFGHLGEGAELNGE
jgi:hypothetical protein